VVDAYQLEIIETLPVTVGRIAIETRKDKNVSELLETLQTGKLIPKTKRFNIDQNDFSLQNNVIMRSSRVYIPKTLQTEVLKELHSGHFGVVKMKSLARSHCWWPAIDRDIENLVRNCANCNKHKNNPPKVEVHVWEAPSAPMQRVHIDFAGPFLGTMYNSYLWLMPSRNGPKYILSEILPPKLQLQSVKKFLQHTDYRK